MAEKQVLKDKHLKKIVKVQVTDFLIPCHNYSIIYVALRNNTTMY